MHPPELLRRGLAILLVIGTGMGSLLPPMLQASCGLPWMVEQLLQEDRAPAHVPGFLDAREQLSSFLSYTWQFQPVPVTGPSVVRKGMEKQGESRSTRPPRFPIRQWMSWMPVPGVRAAGWGGHLLLQRVIWPQAP